MPILRVIGHVTDHRLVPGYRCVREGPVHLADPVRDLLVVQPSPGQVALQFGHHHRRPQRAVYARLGDAEQRVTQVGLQQDAGIQEDG
jgi:hypothetical protein